MLRMERPADAGEMQSRRLHFFKRVVSGMVVDYVLRVICFLTVRRSRVVMRATAS